MRERRHLAPEALIDLIDERGSAEARSHVDVCPPCREMMETLRATLSQAAQVKMPEPSPLFWDHFSARVGEAIDREGRPGAGARGVAWTLRWVGVPVAVGLMLAVGMVALKPAPSAPVDSRVAVSEPAGGDVELGLPADDGVWTFVTTLSDDLAAEDASSEMLTPALGTAERAVDQLSAEERSELVRLLEAELAKRSS